MTREWTDGKQLRCWKLTEKKTLPVFCTMYKKIPFRKILLYEHKIKIYITYRMYIYLKMPSYVKKQKRDHIEFKREVCGVR